jgi:hypothetical protein
MEEVVESIPTLHKSNFRKKKLMCHHFISQVDQLLQNCFIKTPNELSD